MARLPLTIERCPGGWVLRDPALARLAGFDAVPLPFTPEADAAQVLAHLRRLNPHREVRFDGVRFDRPCNAAPAREHVPSPPPPCD